MTSERFDTVVAAMARARTRRAMLAALATATIGAILGDAVPVSAGQATVALQCRGKRSRCRRDGQCCSGRCRKRKGKKRGKCRCSRYQEPCRKSGDCCALGGNPLVCVDGSCET